MIQLKLVPRPDGEFFDVLINLENVSSGKSFQSSLATFRAMLRAFTAMDYQVIDETPEPMKGLTVKLRRLDEEAWPNA